MARGKTRQEARGHRAGEARQRAERVRAEFGLSENEVRSIRTFVNRRGRLIHDATADPEEVIEYFRTRGYDAFKVYRDQFNLTLATYIRQQRAGTYVEGGIGYLELVTAQAGVEDLAWMYYH